MPGRAKLFVDAHSPYRACDIGMWRRPDVSGATRSVQTPSGISPTHRQQQHRHHGIATQHVIQPMLAEVQARRPHQHYRQSQQHQSDVAEPGTPGQHVDQEAGEAEKHAVLDDVTARKAWRVQGSDDANELG